MTVFWGPGPPQDQRTSARHVARCSGTSGCRVDLTIRLRQVTGSTSRREPGDRSPISSGQAQERSATCRWAGIAVTPHSLAGRVRLDCERRSRVSSNWCEGGAGTSRRASPPAGRIVLPSVDCRHEDACSTAWATSTARRACRRDPGYKSRGARPAPAEGGLPPRGPNGTFPGAYARLVRRDGRSSYPRRSPGRRRRGRTAHSDSRRNGCRSGVVRRR